MRAPNDDDAVLHSPAKTKPCSLGLLLTYNIVQSLFFEPLRETKIGSKNRRVQKSVVKLQCSTEEKGTTFGSSYQEVRKNEGSRNRDSTVYRFSQA